MLDRSGTPCARGNKARRHEVVTSPHAHPRALGWIGTTALAIGGSNLSLLLLSALLVGQGNIPGQGSAAIPLLIFGLLLSLAAAPGWTELVLLYPGRVGGIAAACSEAFGRYSPILANLAGVGYWWGWVPACGLSALLSASAIHQWYLPGVPVSQIAIGLVLAFASLNLCGIHWVSRLVLPVAVISSLLAFLSGLLPVIAGKVDWHQATNFHLATPFAGWFGSVTSLMAGLYLVGFAAPAFEAAMCHVGETVNPAREVPRAVFASAMMAIIYSVVLPVVWLGVLGPAQLSDDLGKVLGPTFAPLFGSAGKAAAIGFMMVTMFHSTVQPLAGAARTLAQLAEDGLVPEFLARRNATDTPWIATLATAAMAIAFLLLGDPIWLLASANFTYLISICLPSVAVWLLRRDRPELVRSYRAPRGTIWLGLIAAAIWTMSAILGFQQFGLPTVLMGLAFAYSGAGLYAWRKFMDRRRQGLPGMARTLHLKLTGAMLAVLAMDAVGYLTAVGNVPPSELALKAALEDIFVAVAILTIAVGLLLPGMIAHSAVEVAQAADRLMRGTLADFTRAMQSLGRGDLDDAYAGCEFVPVTVNSRDEVGQMAESFNELQREIADAAQSLNSAREGLRAARTELMDSNLQLGRAKEAAEEANTAKSAFLASMSHELRTPLNAILGFSEIISMQALGPVGTAAYGEYAAHIHQSGKNLLATINEVLDIAKISSGQFVLQDCYMDVSAIVRECLTFVQHSADAKEIVLESQISANISTLYADETRVRQVLINLLSNAVKFTPGQGIVVIVVSLGTDGSLAFAISDTGIGMTQDQIATARQPFRQIDSSLARKYEGTGLGLPLAEGLVRLHGGKLDITSAVNVGTTVVVTFPAHRTGGSVAPITADLKCLREIRL
ncbi:MAG TPA: amino acid permease [Rhizomicrobium sp.]|nr:amino acid permease [Rhizomicrobium sp.]